MPTKDFRKLFTNTIDSIHISICELTLQKNDDFYQLLRDYYSFIHKRTEALFLLVQNDCLWDAEIVLRPIAECVVKFAYISSFDDLDRIEKVREFWEDLAEINMLKQSNQAKQILELTNIDSIFLNDIVLDIKEQNILAEKWTKQIRQRKEQPWSYNEMIKTISVNYNFKEILGLARSFTQSSHLIHADETALGVISDRESRTKEQKEALMSLHEIRLLSDCVSFYFWLIKITSRLSNIDISPIIIKKINDFNDKAKSFKPLEKIIE